SAKLDLSLLLGDGGDGISGHLVYSTDLFEAATIDRFAEQFRLLLDGALASPETALTDLSLLTTAEQRQLLAGAAMSGAAPERCIHELFAEQAARTPEAPAVAGEDEVLTYRELAQRAGSLVRRLRTVGVVPDQPVLLCAERGAGLIVGLLGILGSG